MIWFHWLKTVRRFPFTTIVASWPSFCFGSVGCARFAMAVNRSFHQRYFMTRSGRASSDYFPRLNTDEPTRVALAVMSRFGQPRPSLACLTSSVLLVHIIMLCMSASHIGAVRSCSATNSTAERAWFKVALCSKPKLYTAWLRGTDVVKSRSVRHC